jgi:murein DD-endopeptidase MepM/ murein hydrolase activator NlpD
VDLTLSISGTRIAIDDGDAAGGPTTAEITSSVHERTAEATMSRYGAAYVVTVECRRAGDRRCTTGRYAEGLLRSAELVGGTPEDGGSVPTPAILEEPDLIPTSSDPDFRAEPPGNLIARSGQGVSSSTIYAPGILFPVSAKPVYLNSQVWNIGGANGPRGGWSDPRNYKYPWRDNFCEKRPKYKTPACPAGTGHQGVDIRPSKWKNQDNQKAVAVEAGVIVHLGSYMVTLAGDSGTHYNYLHLRNLRVHVGDRVTAGKVIGTISNNFGKTPTTYHLHFEMRQNRNGRGWQHVPPYTSLLAAYERM